MGAVRCGAVEWEGRGGLEGIEKPSRVGGDWRRREGQGVGQAAHALSPRCPPAEVDRRGRPPRPLGRWTRPPPPCWEEGSL